MSPFDVLYIGIIGGFIGGVLSVKIFENTFVKRIEEKVLKILSE